MKISFSQRQKLYEQDLKADLWIKCRASDALILIEANENPREETGLGLARKTAETLPLVKLASKTNMRLTGYTEISSLIKPILLA